MRLFFCRLFGHRWRSHDIVYRFATTQAYVGDVPWTSEIGVTWVNDETCSRCGCESWWPA